MMPNAGRPTMTAPQASAPETGQPSPQQPHAGWIVLTLAVGTASGWLFQGLGVPLPWMLGSLCACGILAIAGLPLAMPKIIRSVVLPLLGVMLGTNFSPSFLGQLLNYAVTMVAMIALMAVLGWGAVTYYRRIAGFDHPTGFFAGMPGGLVDMAVLGEEAGGDVRRIALVHATRIAVIVATVPFIVQFAEHVSLGPRQSTPVSIWAASPSTYVWVVGVALAGVMLGQILRLPAKFMLGPLILSAIVHGGGWTDFVIPSEIINAAQVFLGCASGCRFTGFARRELVTIIGHSVITNGVLVAVTCAVAWLLAPYSAGGFSSVLLAFAAGGLSEMSLVALALHLDIAFVLVHQLARIALVIVIAPFAFRAGPNQPPNRG